MEEPPKELMDLNVSKLEEIFSERELDKSIIPPFVIRLDGVRFGKSLAGFERPRDPRVRDAMIEAAKRIIREMQADLAYLASDEINVIFLRYASYSGRILKLCTISSSIASSVVTRNLDRILAFDSRIVLLENEDDARRYILYRARVGFNNLVNSLLELRGLRPERGSKLPDRIRMLEKSGLRLSDLPTWVKYGCSVFWRRYLKESSSGPVERRRLVWEEGYEHALHALDTLL